MLGYWNKKEETDEVIIDGWLHTGDIGEIDPEDSYLKITDRKKDIIVSTGGDNISPAKIENMITNDYYFYTFTILILAVFLTVLQTALSMYFVLFKKLNILALFFVFVAIINVIANFLIMKYGIIAAAVSTLISYFILNVLIINWLRLKGVKLKL